MILCKDTTFFGVAVKMEEVMATASEIIITDLRQATFFLTLIKVEDFSGVQI